jgi:glycosyltransferase involved in cell wall biosynthesis
MSNTPRTRVLFIVPSLERGGAETQVIDMINGLEESRYEIHVGVFSSKLQQMERLRICDAAVCIANRNHKFDFSAARQFARLIDEHEIDVVHCTLQMAVLMGWVAVRLAKRTPHLVAAIHTTINRHRKNDIADRLIFYPILRRCGRIVFVCHAQAEHWQRKFPTLERLSTVVYNGVDTTKFDATKYRDLARDKKHALGVPASSKIISCIARFRPEKGHRFLIEAFAQLSGQPHLILAGDGDLRESIEIFVRRCSIQDRVHFLGDVKDVREILAITDITVLASTAVETFSIAMLESMSMGVPVVATDIGGLREAITPMQTGALVAPGDARALQEALHSMLDDEHLANLGDNARVRVLEQFSQRAMITAMDGLFSSLMDTKGQPQ